MKRVLLATRPITPPWDEASKNFAYFLGKSITNHALTLLGTRTLLPELPVTNTVSPIFRTGHLNSVEKMRLFWYLWRNRDAFDITHYLFTPTKQNSALIKKFVLPTKGHTVQTIATLREDLYTEAELKDMLFADKLVVYTEAKKRKLQQLGFNNVTCIYPGIDLNLYRPALKNETLLRSLGLTSEHFIVAYPGEYVRLGATDTLTEFCITFFQNHPDTNVRFLFACRIKNSADAQKKLEVEQRLKEAGVEKFVAFVNNVPEMMSLYNTVDVVLFPVENLAGKFDVPLVIIEAYACKKPVILSDLPQFAEFSGPDICVTIPKGNIASLEEKINLLLTQPEQGQVLGNAARAFVEAKFDLQKTAEEYSRLYNDL